MSFDSNMEMSPEMAEVRRKLAQTCNDPSITITCWCHTWCGLCHKIAGDCKCKGQPWNRGCKRDPFKVPT